MYLGILGAVNQLNHVGALSGDFAKHPVPSLSESRGLGQWRLQSEGGSYEKTYRKKTQAGEKKKKNTKNTGT